MKKNPRSEGDRHRNRDVELTLSDVLLVLVAHQLSHAAPVVQVRVAVIGLERLTGAVGLLGGHAALLRLQGRGGVLEVLPAAAPGQGSVRTLLHVHLHGDRRCCS